MNQEVISARWRNVSYHHLPMEASILTTTHEQEEYFCGSLIVQQGSSSTPLEQKMRIHASKRVRRTVLLCLSLLLQGGTKKCVERPSQPVTSPTREKESIGWVSTWLPQPFQTLSKMPLLSYLTQITEEISTAESLGESETMEEKMHTLPITLWTPVGSLPMSCLGYLDCEPLPNDAWACQMPCFPHLLSSQGWIPSTPLQRVRTGVLDSLPLWDWEKVHKLKRITAPP